MITAFSYYDIVNYDYGVGYTHGNNTKFIFDKADYDLIKGYSWGTNKDGYIVARLYDNTKRSKIIRMQNLIYGVNNIPKGNFVDHINHCVSDNRRKKFAIG